MEQGVMSFLITFAASWRGVWAVASIMSGVQTFKTQLPLPCHLHSAINVFGDEGVARFRLMHASADVAAVRRLFLQRSLF